MILLDLDPNIVKPGWTPLLITIGIAVAMVFLFVSMRRQFRRISAPTAQAARAARQSEAGVSTAASSNVATSTPATSNAATSTTGDDVPADRTS